MKPIISKINDIKGTNATQSINFNIFTIIPKCVKRYYSYTGSLTLPTCTENVEWFISVDHKLYLSESQLVTLQTLKNELSENILTNARALQNLNGRTIRRSFKINYYN